MPVTHVPLLDLTRLDPELERELEGAFRRVLESGQFILGPEVSALEEECARYCGVRHAIGVSSGTDALLIALMALEIGPGDEIICPSYTFFATAGSIWRTGARPVFADSLPASLALDPADVERRITSKTRAIIPVHLFGQCAPMRPLLEIASRHGLYVIEDAAQAIGSEYEGTRAGSMGAIGCFSFFPSKNLSALGDGGLVTTNDSTLAEKVEVLRVHGGKPKYHHLLVGGNFRLDALQAAFLRSRLTRLDEMTSRRQRNAALYTEALAASGLAAISPSDADVTSGAAALPDGVPLVLPPLSPSRHIYNQYVVRVRQPGLRDELRTFLAEHGVSTEVYYPIPLHLQECFAPLGGVEGDCPVAEEAAGETLALPIFPELREEEIRYVSDQIVAFFR